MSVRVAAVRLATSGARFVSITGPAGTGKGYASSAMSRAVASAGPARARGGGRAGRTARQAAADAGADEALNLNLLLTRLEHGLLELTANDVLLVDEAGMVDQRPVCPAPGGGRQQRGHPGAGWRRPAALAGWARRPVDGHPRDGGGPPARPSSMDVVPGGLATHGRPGRGAISVTVEWRWP